MQRSYKNWNEFRTSIKKCSHNDCKRNRGDKLPILFNRKESSLSKIKFIVISQEPGVQVKRKSKNTQEIEEELLEKCLENKKPSNNSPIKRAIDIFKKNFNPSKCEIYWTHALKCVPIEKNDEIKKHWKKCAPYCKQHFKNELSLIPSRKIVIIPMGGYAMTLCNHVFGGKSLLEITPILEYVGKLDGEMNYNSHGKEITVFPFIHPSYRECHIKNSKYGEAIKKNEEQFEKIIRSIL